MVNIDAPETYECHECKDTLNPDVDDCRWSSIVESWFCWSCYESDTQYASTVILVDEDVRKYYVADNFVFDEYGDDLHGTNLTIRREYKQTDGWRGYSIDGWSDVLTGWTTGGWDDPIARRKADFNEWAEGIGSGELIPPCPVAVVSDPTSNVFSTAISVLVPTDSVDVFRDWLGEDADNLNNALS